MIFKNNLFCFSEKRGQGILEVVVAMSVVVMGLISIMSLIFFNINVQDYNHNMLIASNLAREGIEIVRNIRDNNWLDSAKDWDFSLFGGENNNSDKNSFIIFNEAPFFNNDDFIYSLYRVGTFWEDCIDDDFIFAHAPCRLDIVPIKSDSNYKIYNTLGYAVDENEPTNFYQMIYINEICSFNDEEYILDDYGARCEDFSYEKIGMQVISKVGWKNKGSMKTIEAEERLYNWK